MIRLRRIGLVLGAALAALVARMVVDGPELLDGLIGALILVLLLCSLVLRRQGQQLRPGASSQTTLGDPRSRRDPDSHRATSPRERERGSRPA
jgi:hypothetical protein